jgi:hypothetical protein
LNYLIGAMTFISKFKILGEFEKLGNTNYVQFVKEIANYKSLETVSFHFYNHQNYYKLLFDLGKYEYFYAKNFEPNDYESSLEYNTMLDLKYPDRKNKRKPIINEAHKTIIEDLSREETRYIARIDKFTLKEKYFLLAVLHNSIGSNNKDGEVEYQYEKLPIGEYLRVIAITKDLINNDIFYKDLGKISIYTELKKKHKLINKNDYDVFIFEINKKLKDLKLPYFKKFLQEFLFKT